MTKEEMFEWLDKNKASITRHPPIQWLRYDMTEFYSDFTLSSGGVQWTSFPTLAEAIQFADKLQRGKQMTEEVKQDWRDGQWYNSNKACVVCGSFEMVGGEPRLGYSVCERHSKLSPVEVSQKRQY